jgi:hypothetical protein
VDEQIALMRRLWVERSVNHEGQFDRVVGAGLAPRPVQRPIPIWLGGLSPAAYRRIGRLADGWFPRVSIGPELDQAREIIDQAAAEAGRDPATLGLEGQAKWSSGGLEGVLEQVQGWREAQATHVSIDTMGSDLPDLDAHLEALTSAAQALGLRPRDGGAGADGPTTTKGWTG